MLTFLRKWINGSCISQQVATETQKSGELRTIEQYIVNPMSMKLKWSSAQRNRPKETNKQSEERPEEYRVGRRILCYLSSILDSACSALPKCFLREEIEGEKKYSPPLVSTQILSSLSCCFNFSSSVGVKLVGRLAGSWPLTWRGGSSSFALTPMSASKPGTASGFGGNFTLLTQARSKVSTRNQTVKERPIFFDGQLTSLNKSKPTAQITLVAYKQEPSLKRRLCWTLLVVSFVLRHFLPVLDTVTHDSMNFISPWFGVGKRNIISRIGFTSMSCVGAILLSDWLIVTEVIVDMGVCCEIKIVY